MAVDQTQTRIEALEGENQHLKAEVQRLKEENRRWARLAGTDGLTGLPNKISFMRALVPQALQQAAEAGESIGFILMSVDNLGIINETHGRAAGDQIIRGVSKLLESILDTSDKLGHLDGTHFAVVLLPADLDQVRARANMLRAHIRAHEFPCGDGTAQVMVSAGIVALKLENDLDRKSVGETIFQSLNEALYQAKVSGGNQVQVVENDPLFPSE